MQANIKSTVAWIDHPLFLTHLSTAHLLYITLPATKYPLKKVDFGTEPQVNEHHGPLDRKPSLGVDLLSLDPKRTHSREVKLESSMVKSWTLKRKGKEDNKWKK